jgi:magnesium transporter
MRWPEHRGNAGHSGLALGEVGLRDWWRVMRREILAGIALGAILGSIGFLRIALWSAFSDIYGEHWLLIAMTVAFSVIGVVLWGTLTGRCSRY